MNLMTIDDLLYEAAGFRIDGIEGNKYGFDFVELIYHNILNQENPNLSQISQCYLGFAKIVGLNGDHKLGIELAEKSLKEGSQNDLRTLVWLVNKKELDIEKREYYADIVNNTDPKELFDEDERNFHKWAQAKVSIGLANAWIMQLNNFRRALQIGRDIHDDYIVIESLLGLGKTRLDENVDCLKEALEIGRKLNDLEVQIECLYRIGQIIKVPKEEKIKYLLEAIELAKLSKSWKSQALCHIALGNLKIDQELNYNGALELANRINDPVIKAQSLIGLGRAQMNQEFNFIGALEIGRKLQNSKIIVEALIGLGSARVNDIQNYTEAIAISRSIPSKDGGEKLLAESLIGLGNCHVNQKSSYYEALSIGKYLEDFKIQIDGLIGLGNCRVEPRKEHYYQALELSHELGDDNLILKSLWGLINARVDVFRNATKALEVATRIGNIEKQIDAIVRLAWEAITVENTDEARKLLNCGFEIAGNNNELKAKLQKPFRILCVIDEQNYKSGLRIAESHENIEMEVICYLGLYYHCVISTSFHYAQKFLDKARKKSKFSSKTLQDQVEEATREYSTLINRKP